MLNPLERAVSDRTRRLAVAAVAAVLVLATAVPALADNTAPTTLRDAAGRIKIGTAIGLPQLFTDPTYASVAAAQFNSVTPENAMKWDTTEPQQGVFNFGPADSIVQFAQQHGQAVRGHNLVWHNQLPSWLTSTSWTPDELRAVLRNHILTEAGHFRGEVYAWDVVNEPFNDSPPGTLRNTMWLQTLGPSYIADAFRWAHQADPSAKLYLNDYNIEGINAKSDAMYNLVKELLAEGVPVSGVGIQGHLGAQYGFDPSIVQNIRRFTQLGVEVSITELDVRMVLPPTQLELDRQVSYYDQVTRACLADARCVGITVWGFTDRYSWVPSVFAGQGQADIFDADYNAKPAYWAMLADLAAAPPK